jgi:sterol desaturase/sphingolipid hydroxylase (fatty acid hydroxylase superfamily)
MMEGIVAIAVFGMIIVICVAPVVGVVLIARFLTRNARRQNELKAEIYKQALEKGVELPQDFFRSEVKARNPQRAFNAGVICMAVGLGIALAFAIIGGIAGKQEAFYVAALGAIPTLIGAAYFTIYFVGKKQGNGQAR